MGPCVHSYLEPAACGDLDATPSRSSASDAAACARIPDNSGAVIQTTFQSGITAEFGVYSGYMGNGYSGDMGNTVGPNGFSIGSSRHVSSSKYPGSNCMKLTSQMRSSTCLIPTIWPPTLRWRTPHGSRVYTAANGGIWRRRDNSNAVSGDVVALGCFDCHRGLSGAVSLVRRECRRAEATEVQIPRLNTPFTWLPG